MKPRTQSLLNLALATATAGVGTWWGLQLTAARPPAERAVAVDAQPAATRPSPTDMVPVARLFGAEAAAPAGARVRLVGVIAEGGRGAGVALLAVEGQPVAVVRAGEPVGDSGFALVEVRADQVRVQGPGGTEIARLPAPAAPAGIAPAR